MNSLLHVCIYNTDENAIRELEDSVCALNFIRLESFVSSPEQLEQVLLDQTIHIVFFNLDPDSESVVEVIEQVTNRHPEVALLAASCKNDPESILAPMRAGCDQFICKPIDLEDLSQAVKRVASKRFAVQHKSRLICITGSGGGVGTTSIACNLAMEIGEVTGRPCALIDLDLQFGDVATNFDTDPKYTIYDLAMAGADLDSSVLESALSSLPCKVRVLARPEMIENAEAVTSESIYRILELLMHGHENIVCDVPHNINPITNAAMINADLIFIVTQLSVPSIRNAKRYTDTLIRSGLSEDKIAFIVNRYGGRSNGRITLQDFKEAIGKAPFGCVPNDYQFVARSIDFGRPIAALDHNSPVRVAIHKIAKQIIKDPSGAIDNNEPTRGFFKRLLSK